MKKVIFIGMALIILCLSGCKENESYTFMHPLEKITSIDLIYVEQYCDYNTYDGIPATKTIPTEQWPAFIEDFRDITCKYHSMDPTYSTSGTIIRILYSDGSHEVISAYTGLHISSDGKGNYTPFCFDKDEFTTLIETWGQTNY